MSMSRKHIQAFADTFRFTRPDPRTQQEQYTLWVELVRNLANDCSTFNVNFNYQTFYAACGGINGEPNP